MALGFHVATDRCYGCKTCTVSCANEHLLSPGVHLRRVRQINAPEPVGHAFVAMSCNHCDEPACVANCPVGAYTKQEDTGLVIQDHSICIGCKTCIMACPFNAPAYCEADSTTYKCDGCINRQKAGLAPVCTVTCPSGNITMDEAESLPEGESVKDVVATKPNLVVTLDKELAIEAFVDIDGWSETVDRGGEGY